MTFCQLDIVLLATLAHNFSFLARSAAKRKFGGVARGVFIGAWFTLKTILCVACNCILGKAQSKMALIICRIW